MSGRNSYVSLHPLDVITMNISLSTSRKLQEKKLFRTLMNKHSLHYEQKFCRTLTAGKKTKLSDGEKDLFLTHVAYKYVGDEHRTAMKQD